MTAADERAYPWHGAPPAPPNPRARVQGRRAGLVTRVAANVVDAVVVLLLLGGIWLGVAAARYLVHPTGFRLPDPGAGTLLLVGLGVQAAYFAVTWVVDGGTYGDRLLGLRVTGDRRFRLGWGRCVVRAVLCVLFPAGLLWVLVSRQNRSVQDLLVRTSVVYDWPPG